MSAEGGQLFITGEGRDAIVVEIPIRPRSPRLP